MKKFVKALTFTLIGGIAGLSVNAQCVSDKDVEPNFGADEETAKQKISIYGTYQNAKNWKDAANAWWNAQELAPKYKPSMYKNAAYYYKQIAKEVKKADPKSPRLASITDTLCIIYDRWAENFGDCHKIDIGKARAIASYQFSTRYEDVNKIYKKVIADGKAGAMSVSDLDKYYSSTAYIVKKTKDCELLLNEYEVVTKIADNKIAKATEKGDTKTIEGYNKFLVKADKIVDPCASCEKLIEIYKPQVEDDKENVELIEKVLGKLSKKKCKEPYVLELTEHLHSLQPTYKSSLLLGNAYDSKGEYSKALGYFEQALGYEEIDEATVAEIDEAKLRIYETQGSYKKLFAQGKVVGGCQGKKAQAKAVYMSVGSCAKTKTEQAAMYTYAIELCEAAGSCANSLKETCEKSLPTQTSVFTEGVTAGKSLSVPCWGTTVKVRLN